MIYKIGLVLTSIWIVYLIFAFATYEEMEVLIAYFALAIGSYIFGSYFLIVCTIDKFKTTRKKPLAHMVVAALWICIPLWIWGYSYVEKEIREFAREQRIPTEDMVVQSIDQLDFNGIADIDEGFFKYERETKHLNVNVHIDSKSLLDFYKGMREEIKYEAIERDLTGEALTKFVSERSSGEIEVMLNRLFARLHDQIWERTEMPNKITVKGYIGNVLIYQSSTINGSNQLNQVKYQIIEDGDRFELKFYKSGQWNEVFLTE